MIHRHMKNTQNKKTKILHVRITEQIYKYLCGRAIKYTIAAGRPVSFSEVVRKILLENMK